MIKPSVGRVVWYHPHKDDKIARIGDEPLAAIVCGVWSDTCVNLVVFDANGCTRKDGGMYTSVLLWQEGAPRPEHSFAEWMPYQKGQATKTEALEAALKDSKDS